MASFKGKAVLITGGSKGIGAATATLLAKQGANVAINYGSDSKAAEALLAQIGGPERHLAIQADAGSIPDIEKMVAETVGKFGKIDVLIPNAGVLPMKDLDNTTEADFDKTYALNVKGPYFLAQKAAPHMAKGSHIIFISTGLCTWSGVSPAYLLYISSKGAIEQMVRGIAKGLAPKGINVNAVAPGPTGTELFLRGKSQQVLDMISSNIPFGRLAEPEEIAEAIVFMGSESSRWVTGQVLRANGGMSG